MLELKLIHGNETAPGCSVGENVAFVEETHAD